MTRMMNPDDKRSIRKRGPQEIFDPRRRTLLRWIPSAIFAAIGTTLATAAYRFLRPARADGVGGKTVEDSWTSLGQVASLSSDGPVLRKVSVEKRVGWSLERGERTVYVLPGPERAVVSAVCPHEQCEVAWDAGAREFLCPCHDSRFGPDGSRLAGPAASDLKRFASRVDNDVLQIRIQDSGTTT